MQHTRKYFFVFLDIYVCVCVCVDAKKPLNKYMKKPTISLIFLGAGSSLAHVAGLNPVGLAGSLVGPVTRLGTKAASFLVCALAS
jgi:hypothetical protein